ncbi:MAG: transporter substrate-binding domain-containing protein [Gammaproteobacteria bacterium]|nr:transporter substrate-binding domain-containing protein [Gammaproteobacteria bacterium]MCP5443989.1 transporter substrate-binding domain-containing protein [Chromatiaceae bacterium]
MQFPGVRRALPSLLPVMLALFCCSAVAQSRVVRVGAYDNPPKISVARDGRVTGFWPDLLADIAAREQWRIEYVTGSWADGLRHLRENSIDIMPDVAFTPEREKLYLFSGQTVLSSWTRLYIQRDDNAIESIRDLQGKRVAALRESVNLEGAGGLRELARGFDIDVTFVELDDYQSVFKAIEEGRVDAGITNRNFGDLNEDRFAVKSTPIIFQPISMRFAFPMEGPSSKLLVERIDTILKALKSDNKSLYYRLLARYFETGIAEKRIEVLPAWFQNALRSVALVMLLFIALVVLSRMQVRRQTREIRQSSEALAAEKERLEVTLASIGDAVIATDVGGAVVLLNKIAEELTGWNRKDAIGLPLQKVFQIVDERNGRPFDDPVTRVLQSNQIVGLASHTALIARDGTRRSIADSGAPIRDAKGATLGVILVFRDISAHKRTEEELLKIRKLESLGVLAGGIAHDFNNILASILGYTSLALLDRDTSETQRSRLQEVEKAANRARDLTQQLLTFSKGGEPVKQIASIPGVIRDSADFVLRGGNVSCSYKFADDLWAAEFDQGQISQVIQNLIINAAQAMPTGGTIEVTGENFVQTTSNQILDDGNFVRICIRDHGIGIPSELCRRIFDPYFTTKQEGSGLGLAITHSIIARHNGHISVESIPGEGSAFTILLPATKGLPPSRSEQIAAVPGNSGSRILVMDDDEMMRELATEMLSLAGYQVTTVREGNEAINLYAETLRTGETFDLVILDLTVRGGMGGKDAVQGILDIDPAARVIVASGYSNDPVMAHYQNYGFRAAIAKPYNVADFTATVAEVLSEHAPGLGDA